MKQKYDTNDDLLEGFARHGAIYRDVVEETISRQKAYAGRFLKAIDYGRPDCLVQLNSETIQNFLFQYSTDYGPGSLASMRASLKAFLRFCEHNQLVSDDLKSSIPPVHRQRLAKVPFGLSEEEIEDVLESPDRSTPRGKRDFSILLILATYGVRSIQVRRLKLEDVAWKEEEIHFRPVKRGKTVSVPLTCQVGNSLLDYLRVRPKTMHLEIFLDQENKPIANSTNICWVVHSALRKADVQVPEGVTKGAHLFRHSFASRLLNQETPFKNIADLLGHRDINSTFIYTKVDHKRLAEACLEWPEVQI